MYATPDGCSDDDSIKDVYFQAVHPTYSEISSRHVLPWWLYGRVAEDVLIPQVV